VTSVISVASAVYDSRICGALDSGLCGSSHPAADRRVAARFVAVMDAAEVVSLEHVDLAAVLSEGVVGLGSGWR